MVRVSKDDTYLFGMVILEEFECFERFVSPSRLTKILKSLSKRTSYGIY